MKVYKYLLTLVFFMMSVDAQDKISYDGYAFMMFGVESVNYQEKASLIPTKSDVTAINIVQMSGGLTRVNELFDFSIATTSTILTQSSTEQWSLYEKFQGIQSGTLLQENSFDVMGSKLKILLHYKQSDNFRFVFGPAYTLDTFKRYNWQPKHSKVEDSTSIQEERYASLQAHFGVAYESYAAAVDGLRLSAQLTYGQPLWQQVKNTKEEFNNLIYSNKNGYNIDASLNAAYTVYKGLELGIYLAASEQYREAAEIKYVPIGDFIFGIEWPENRLTHYRGGLMAVWKFRE